MRPDEAPTRLWDDALTLARARDALDTPWGGRRFSGLVRQVGPYTLLRKLGSGGMASVWMARRHGLIGTANQTVAIKLLSGERAADPRYRRMFVREAEISLDLNNSNIVRVYDAGEHEGEAFMAMEFLDGGNLSELQRALARKGEALPLATITYIIGEVLKGLNYAQTVRIADDSDGVVHRDISPQNILLSVSGEVKVSDFGIARLIADETSGLHVKGKLRYMAPEQIRGEAHDHRVDLYAVGAIFHELVDGRPFRQAANEGEMYHLAMQGVVPPLQHPGLPTQLDAFRRALLEPDPHRRLATAESALELLRSWPGHRDASLELTRTIRRLRGVDAPQSGVYAAAVASGPLPVASGAAPAASASEVETRTRRTTPSPAAASVVDATGGRAERPPSEVETELASRGSSTPALTSDASQAAASKAFESPSTPESAARGKSPRALLLLAGLFGGALIVGSAWTAATRSASQAPESGEGGGSTDAVATTEVAGSPPSETARAGEDANSPAAVAAPSGEVDAPPLEVESGELEPAGPESLEPKPAADAASVPRVNASSETTPEASESAGASSQRDAPSKAAAKVDVLFLAGDFPWARVRIDGREHMLEPRKQLRLRPGKHRVAISEGLDAPFRDAGTLDVPKSGRYQARLRKSPLGVRIAELN